jgi:hypothetical protein
MRATYDTKISRVSYIGVYPSPTMVNDYNHSFVANFIHRENENPKNKCRCPQWRRQVLKTRYSLKKTQTI